MISTFTMSAILVILFGFAGTVLLFSIIMAFLAGATFDDDEFEEDEHAQI